MSPKQSYPALLWRYVRPQRGWVFLLVVLVLGGIGLQLANPQLIRRFLDAAEQGRSLETLLWTGAIFMLIALVAQGLRVAARIRWGERRLAGDKRVACRPGAPLLAAGHVVPQATQAG
jgi:ABC-type multidrug transport system fused ATPase/permease subunit